MEAFQLTATELQNFVALQCIFDGAAVRVFFATATPVMPLALLLACCFLEIFSKGMGISAEVEGLDMVGQFGTSRIPVSSEIQECMAAAQNALVKVPIL